MCHRSLTSPQVLKANMWNCMETDKLNEMNSDQSFK